jgi:methionine-rich copper-binding protein CopC
MSIRSAITVLVTSLGLAVLSAGPAFAHAELVGSSPAADSRVADVTEVSITAGEELLDIGENAEGFMMTVTDSNGLFYGDGCVSVDGDTASMPVALAAAGDYIVDYRVVSNDGHPVEGQFAFTFTGDENAEQSVAYSEMPECGVAQTPVAVDDSDEPANGESDEPMVISPAPPLISPAPSEDSTSWIGFATIPVIAVAIWLLVRALRKRKS